MVIIRIYSKKKKREYFVDIIKFNQKKIMFISSLSLMFPTKNELFCIIITIFYFTSNKSLVFDDLINFRTNPVKLVEFGSLKALSIR